jgi:hypothetical protein
MSAIFRSAAMTLLSKTLQTLLYKYLSDVDVEGVALPSLLYNSSDGHSGWGVRLSNVKLREGAKLLDLPGTTRRKRRRIRKIQRVSKRKQQHQQRSRRRRHPDGGEKKSLENKARGNDGSFAHLDASFSALSLNELKSIVAKGDGGVDSSDASVSTLNAQQEQQQQQHNSQEILLGNIISVDANLLDDEDPEVRAAARAAALAVAYNKVNSNAAATEASHRRGWLGSWYSSSSSAVNEEAKSQPQENEEKSNEAAPVTNENGMTEDDDEVAQSPLNVDTRIQQEDSATVNDVVLHNDNTNNRANSQHQQVQVMTNVAAQPPPLQATDRHHVTNAADTAAASSDSSSPRRRSWFGYFYSSIGPLEEQQQQAPPPLLLKQQPVDQNEASSSLPLRNMHSSLTSGLSIGDLRLAKTLVRGNVTTTTSTVAVATNVDGELVQQPEDASDASASSSSLSPPLLFETPKRKAASAGPSNKSTTSSASDTLLNPLGNNNKSSKTRGLVDGAATIKEEDDENVDYDEDDDYNEYDDDDEERNDDESAYEDFFEEHVAPMILRLGPDGRIGTLDVRLVGKDIHVLVEDADLLVEVVRPPSKKEEDTANNSKAQGAGGSGDASFSSPEQRAKGTEKKKPAIPTPDPKTVGDRVMAENTIARAFSTIPNLLLRDIRVRLVVRDEEEPQGGEQQKGAVPGRTSHDATAMPESQRSFHGKDNSPSSASSGASSTGPTSLSSETVFEVCIELMSVTANGQDFFAHFRQDNDADDSSEAMDAEENEMDESRNIVSTSGLDGDNQTIQENEYLTKRIRTGRGPDGGITIRAFPGGLSNHFVSASRNNEWSRYSWLSLTEFCVLRCSGLDVYARIFMGTRKEVRQSASSLFWYSNDEYDTDFSVDSMLFGVDYIAPGPQPPLPPIDEQTDLAADEEDGQLWMTPEATTYQMDANGIQSTRVGSSFHRVGMLLYMRMTSSHPFLPFFLRSHAPPLFSTRQLEG